MSRKVLFVVAGLNRAGAERFAFEIDAALNKNKFNLSILCLEQKSQNHKNWKERYYEKKHQDLGTKISFLDPFLEKQKTYLIGKIFHKITRSKFKQKKYKFKPTFYDYLNQFDAIEWMGEYTFIHAVPDYIKKKSLIFTMSAKFQDPTIYNNFDFKYPYHFLSGFNNGEEKYEYSQFENITHTFFPLVLKISEKENKWKFNDSKIKKIGIFTRLDRYKPLDPFFYSFQLLLDHMPNCELHIFGNGNPKDEGMLRYLERLEITDKVFFRGHQDDIVKTANDEHLDVSWFQGYNNDRPAGYAGFDICTTGTPLICWDFFPKPFKPENHIYPHFKNLNKFVNYSLEILTNKEKAESLSRVQFADVLETRNVDNFISKMEDLFESIAKKQE